MRNKIKTSKYSNRIRTTELRDPILILKSEEVPDDLYGTDETLKKHAVVWAKYIPAKRDLYGNTNDNKKIDYHEFIIRKDDSVVFDKTHRVLFKNRIFNIMSSKESITVEDMLTIYCIENGMLEDRDVTISDEVEERVTPDNQSNDIWF